jgi:D-3-phosphoglycerate dehydrogenase
MKVLAYDPFISEHNIAGLGIDLVDYKELLPKADFLTIHVPYTADTKYLLDDQAFALMKKGVKIINCARGGIINEESLLKAMENGIVSGLAMDAFEKEPLAADHPFISMPNTICTPHIASWTHEAQNEVALGVAKGVLAALRAEPVTTSLNIPPVSKSNMETIKPYINLVEKMGVLAVHLAEGRIKSIEIKYNGEISQIDTKMLTLAIIKGVLNPILQEAVNFVNAPEVAKARGITVSEIKSKETENFVGSVSVTVRTDKN